MNRKKYLILYVLKILEANTDFKHTMTQKQIAEWLSDVMPCDRKTVGRNIKALTEIGYPIIKTGTDEIAFILDAVRGNATEDLTREQREDIAVRLLPVLTKIYR